MIIIITIPIITVIKLYKIFSSNEKSPNAIPSFQIRVIFKYFDENNSVSNETLLKLITYIFETLSNIKIITGNIILI